MRMPFALSAAFLLMAARVRSDEPLGVYLDGPAGQRAIAATIERASPGGKETEIIHDEQGKPFMAMTHFIVVLEPQATVAEVNAALKSLNARVVGMEKGKDVLEIRIPDPARRRTLKDIEAMATKLERLPVFADALPLTFLPSE